jgi:chorismate dehydratase
MGKRIKISAVSYLNTQPFIHGLKKRKIRKEIDLSLEYPSVCAEKFLSGQVDISLLPTATLPKLNGVDIISNYCIGTNHKVRTVLLLAEKPMDQLTEIYLDYQSATSVKLIRIIVEKYHKLSVEWKKTTEGFEDQVIKNSSGAIVIGDRCFDMENRYPFQYDLGEEWYKITGLPFVFAVWVSRIDLPDNFVSRFNQALQYGIDSIDDVVSLQLKSLTLERDTLRDYFLNNIDYSLTPEKRSSMELFFDNLKELQID